MCWSLGRGARAKSETKEVGEVTSDQKGGRDRQTGGRGAGSSGEDGKAGRGCEGRQWSGGQQREEQQRQRPSRGKQQVRPTKPGVTPVHQGQVQRRRCHLR